MAFALLPLLAAQAVASAVFPHPHLRSVAGNDSNVPRLLSPPPGITAAPLIPEVLLRARSSSFSLPACATACLESAISDDTTCAVTDVGCGCNYANAIAISNAAVDCVDNACGYLTAFYAWSSLESLCDAYSLTHVYSATTATTSRTRSSATTAATAARTASSDDADTTASASTSSSSGSLSKGAIAGIAIGAAGGAVLLCAFLFLIYRCVSRSSNGARTAAAPTAPTTVSASPPSAVGLPASQPELDSKTVAKTTPASSPSTVQPPTHSAGPVSGQWQQQPYVVQGCSIASGQPPQMQTVVAPAGYAAAYPGVPLPGVLYLEAADGRPASHFSQEVPATPVAPTATAHELTGQTYNGGTYEMPTGTR